MVRIDPDRDSLLTEFGKLTLLNQYALPGETCQDIFARAATAFSGGDDNLAQRLYDYASKQWFMFASPLLSNGGTNRGLPISCFLNYVDDSIPGLVNNFQETAFITTKGGGFGTYWGHVRSIGEVSSKGVDTPGVMAFMHCQDSEVLAYHQGSTRRGAGATYLSVDHPEIIEFVNMRSPTGGDINRKNLNLHHGVVLTDKFMLSVKNDSDWDLIDPNSKKIKETVKARDLWIKILQQRVQTGEPYLFFVDAANRNLPINQLRKGLKVHHSNLCTEITLPTDKDRTAVCCLSSLNVATFDEWKGEADKIIEDLVTMLDNTLQVFIDNAPTEMHRAVFSASQERAIGLGTMGLSSYFQKRMWSMKSVEARNFNKSFYGDLKTFALQATRKLAKERGECPDTEGTGRRHSHLIAIAPNATSSIICGGISPSTEPLVANAFTQKTMSGSQPVYNPVLRDFLTDKGENTEEVWRKIILDKGSVRSLDFLTDYEKEVFATASEIDPDDILTLAHGRHPYICQAQSINLFTGDWLDVKRLHQIHMRAWELGLKSLYYLRSSAVKSTSVGVMPENLKTEVEPGKSCELGSDCKSCEG